MVREGFESSNTSKTRNNLYVWGLDRGLLFDAEDGGANGTRLAGVGLLIVAGVTPRGSWWIKRCAIQLCSSGAWRCSEIGCDSLACGVLIAKRS